MHGRWTYSPNEEAREVGGELYFFFSFGAPCAGLLDTFQNLPRSAWAGEDATRRGHAHCPPTPSSGPLCASLHQLHRTALLQNCYKSQPCAEHQHEHPLSSLLLGMEQSGAHCWRRCRPPCVVDFAHRYPPGRPIGYEGLAAVFSPHPTPTLP